MLRKLVDPISNSNDPLAIYPLDIDTSRQPRYLGRRLGIPDATAPTGYDDGLIIYRLRDSSFQINVNVSSALVTDELNRTHLENYTPLVIRMSSIYHPPIYSLD